MRFRSYLNGLVVFPTFFNLSLNLAIRSSWSEPQLTPSLVFADCIQLLHLWLQEYTQSDFGIDHLVMSMCRIFSCVFGRGCLLWPVHSLGKILLAFVLLHFVLQGQICLLLKVFLDFLLLHTSPLWWNGHLFWVLILEGLVGLHRTIQLQLLQHWWDIDLDYWDIERFALEMNRDNSFIFETAQKYCILDSFVDCEGYSIFF